MIKIQKLTNLEERLKTIPDELDENDKVLEDIIAKIINMESNNCNYIPSSSTSVILQALKHNALEKVKEEKQKKIIAIEDQDQD